MATKGWSFPGLTDALKAGAFFDATTAGALSQQIPVVDGYNNLVLGSDTSAKQPNGFYIRGSNNNQVALTQNVGSDGAVPINNYAGVLALNWFTNSVLFGILRGPDQSSLGYGFRYNGTTVYQYMPGTTAAPLERHKLRGSVYTSKVEVGPNDGSTTGLGEVWASVSSPSKTQITLKHQSKQWNFMPTGGITIGNIDADASAGGVRCVPSAGNWESIYDRSAGLLVDLTGANASTLIKAVAWGVASVFAIEAAWSANRAQARMQWGGTFIHFDDVNNQGSANFNLSRGSIQAAAGDVIANRNLVCYNGEVKVQNAIFARDGNAYGTAWGGWLSNWLSNNNTQIYNNMNARVADIRWANERFRNTGERGVVTRSYDDGSNTYISDLQFYRPTTGWTTTGWV
ncbi:TPA: hypothetical protein SIF59_004305 [Escherichia coli]|nr:hypothetical protein [Escherichia coli]